MPAYRPGPKLCKSLIQSLDPVLTTDRHFEDVVILLCVRRYLRYSLTYRDLEE